MPLWPYPWQRIVDPLAIPAGALRHQIRIQKPVGTQDAFGQEITSDPVTVLTCFAAIQTISMREQFQEGFVSQVIHKVTIRFPGHTIPITASMQVVRGRSLYLVQAVENVQQRNRVLHMTCLEIDDAKVGQ